MIQRYEPAVRRFCRSRTRTPEDADDAGQDTFMRYLRRSDRNIRNPEAWLITAAWRACADINRRHRRTENRIVERPLEDHRDTEYEPESFIDHGAPDPEQVTVDHLLVKALLRCLTPRERTVVTHLYLMGASATEVAAYLGVTRDHVRVIAMRARAHARSILAGMERART